MTVYGVTCVLSMAAAFTASATTIILPSDEQLIHKASVIVTGTVVSSAAVERDGRIWTETMISVAHAHKGEVPERLMVREIGGEVGNRITKIFGTPEFDAGERVLLFLDRDSHGVFRTVDLFVGKFREGKTVNGRRLWVRDARQDVSLLDEDFREIEATNVQRDAAGFEAFVDDRVKGRAGRASYGVENPVLEESVGLQNGGITSNFTLISEPTVYRWTRFDSGQSAVWYSSGSQPGYTNGGLSELRTAMASWTGYSAAKIHYSYAGSRSGSMGGLNAPNGVNEVLFNDPLSEISGTFSGSGVVGTGGFNGTSGSTNWTAPFTADASHTAGSKRAITISEGNLTIQDGVTASVMSSSRLAEILAHEFGHTLGFGHSEDGTALMYRSITGRGPSLRADDQTAARWLYPNGSAPPPPPPPPAAPSGLNATVSGSNLDLTWVDNASNETGQSIWLAAGSGAFNRVSDVGANVRSARLSGLTANTYRVYVTAVNAAGSSAPSNTITKTVAAASTPPVAAAFDLSTSSPQTGETVRFTDRSSGSPTRWAWSFGDGGTSSAQNPQRVFSGPGTYTVRLTASNATSSSMTSRQITVSSVQAYHTLVSAAAQTNGVGGTVWRTELTIFNAGSQSANVTLLFLSSAGSGVISKSVYLAPRKTATYANALVDLFSVANGSGAIAIDATSAGATPQLRVTNRTYTNGTRGTYGQAVPNVAPSGLERNFFLTAMQANARFRTNVGLVNRSGASVPVSMILQDSTGATIATTSTTLAPNSFRQSGLAQFFPAIGSRSYDVLSMRISAGAEDAVSVYASVIDNESQDPIYVQARPGAKGSELTIPVAGRAPGANGTFWRTDVTLFNPTGSRLTLALRYDGATRWIALDGGDTVVLADVVSSQFGRSSGMGALKVSWSGTSGPVVTSRTYTSMLGTSATFGQSIDPVTSFSRSAFVTGLRGDSAYRSNIGFVNGGSETETFQVILLSAFGSELGRKAVTLPAGAQTQSALNALFPGASSTAFTVQVAGDADARLFVYGSMVDSLSGDPVFYAGQ